MAAEPSAIRQSMQPICHNCWIQQQTLVRQYQADASAHVYWDDHFAWIALHRHNIRTSSLLQNETYCV